MPNNTLVFECYGHGEAGCAVVLAANRGLALLACREWLGWNVAVAFSAPEKFTLWMNSGGTLKTPVIYAADAEHYAALTRKATPDVPRGWVEATYDRE